MSFSYGVFLQKQHKKFTIFSSKMLYFFVMCAIIKANGFVQILQRSVVV